MHKSNDQPPFLKDKENYLSVSILPILSNIYERAINAQLMGFFETKFHTYLSAFRPGYGCQSTLLRIIEDWTQAALRYSVDFIFLSFGIMGFIVEL